MKHSYIDICTADNDFEGRLYPIHNLFYICKEMNGIEIFYDRNHYVLLHRVHSTLKNFKCAHAKVDRLELGGELAQECYIGI